MKRRSVLLLAAVGACLSLAVTAMGQDAAAPEGASACAALDELRDGAPTSRQHPLLDNCVGEMLSELAEAASSPLTIDRGISDFDEQFRAHYRHEDNSRAFKEKFAERAAPLLRAELAKGQELPPERARVISRGLLVLNSLLCREALVDGLAFPDQVVRYLSAKGLIAINGEIDDDAQLTQRTLNVLARAGESEANGVVVAMIYRACAYENEARSAEAVNAILRILDGRLALLRRLGKNFDRAELVAVDVLDAAVDRGRLNDDVGAEIVRRLAPLLRMHTQRFGQDGVQEHEIEALKDTIDVTETLLKKVVAPSSPPGISEKMQKGGDGVAAEMELELVEWIGTEQDEGVLNRAPWNVPRGAP